MRKLSTKFLVLAVCTLFAATQVSAAELDCVETDNLFFETQVSLTEEIPNLDENLSIEELIGYEVCDDYVAEDNMLANYMLGASSRSEEDVLAENNYDSEYYDVIADMLAKAEVADEYTEIVNDIAMNLTEESMIAEVSQEYTEIINDIALKLVEEDSQLAVDTEVEEDEYSTISDEPANEEFLALADMG